MSKQPPTAPTARAVGPCPTLIQTSRTPRHCKFTQHHRTTRPPPSPRFRESIKRYRRERSDSDEEEEIPLAEVARRLREREARLAQENKNSDSENQLKSENSDLSVKLEHSSPDSEKETASESNKSMNQGNQSSTSSALSSEEADNSIMDIDQVCKFRQKNYKRRKSPPKVDKIKKIADKYC